MIESLLNHRWHVVLMENNEEIKNIKSMTLGYGLGILEEYLTGEVFLKMKSTAEEVKE